VPFCIVGLLLSRIKPFGDDASGLAARRATTLLLGKSGTDCIGGDAYGAERTKIRLRQKVCGQLRLKEDTASAWKNCRRGTMVFGAAPFARTRKESEKNRFVFDKKHFILRLRDRRGRDFVGRGVGQSGTSGVRLPAAGLPVIVAAVWFFGAAGSALAQTPPPQPLPASSGNIYISTPSTVLEIGTRYLRHLGTEAARSTGAPSQFSPSGGGADLDAAPQSATQIVDRYRVWFEGYGVRSEMDPRGDFGGDKRRSFGGIAGLGMILTPGVSVGISVDQSRTDVDIIQFTQSSTIDLTQVGGNIAFESGPWVLGVAAIHGFGNVDSQRGTTSLSRASYDTRLWGALTELSYLWSSGNWRIVPKIGADWARTDSDGFTESGGTQPVIGSTQIAERTRIFGGAEVGYTWLASQTIMDFSVYGRGVDIVDLDAGGLTVSPILPGALPRFIAGVSEDRLGFDTGAAFSVRFSPRARFYAVYDGRFRGNFESHAGTLGLEFRW
jgi:hypothetical protein